MNYTITERPEGDYQFILKESFSLELGGTIEPLELVYETYGALNAKKDNVIVIHHALSPSHHVASHPRNTTPGWWEDMVGPGKPLNTNHYYIICINNIGSCFGSSSPISLNPKTHKPYASDFPTITIGDMVRSQKLLIDALGIDTLFAVIGNSVGAMLSLTWAMEFPSQVKHLISISSCYKAYPANIANRVVQREVIQLDPAWNGGHYSTHTLEGLRIARKLGHFTYRNPDNLNKKFKDNEKKALDEPCDIENYLNYNATKFADKFDANCYLTLLNAMDLFDVTRHYKNEIDAFKTIQAAVLVISVDSDVLFTPTQQEDLYQKLKKADINVTFIQHYSHYGHDTFLVETDTIGGYIENFLSAKLKSK